MHFFIIKRKAIYFIGILIFAMLCVYVNGANAVKTMTSKENIPIYCVKTDEKKIAITFDSAWDDNDLTDFSKLLNRLSGMADEMSSYFRRMKQEKEAAKKE